MKRYRKQPLDGPPPYSANHRTREIAEQLGPRWAPADFEDLTELVQQEWRGELNVLVDVLLDRPR